MSAFSFENFLPSLTADNRIRANSPNSINPATAKRGSANMGNSFMSSLFSIGSAAAEKLAIGWVDKKLNKTQKETSNAQAQLATNFWNEYNGSGPIDPGLAAINARLSNQAQFMANPITNRDNPSENTNAGQNAATSYSLIFGGIAMFAVVLVLIFK